MSFVRESAWPIHDATARASLGMSDALRTGVVSFATTWYNLAGISCDLHGARHSMPIIGGDSGSPIWPTIGVHSGTSGLFATVQLAVDMWGGGSVVS